MGKGPSREAGVSRREILLKVFLLGLIEDTNYGMVGRRDRTSPYFTPGALKKRKRKGIRPLDWGCNVKREGHAVEG